MMKRTVFAAILFLCSCSTLKTLDPAQTHIQAEHRGKVSYCKQIPRYYSGLSYNLCRLYGEPSAQVNVGGSMNGVPFLIIDTAFSTIADTIALPYTIVTHLDKGPIKVN